jgi:hypothetical protein
MKVTLAALLCFVLFASECFAIKGGPVYPGGSTSITGTYAGVLQPAFDPTDPFSTNSLGVFTIGVPSSGASTGNFLMFTRGRVFGGTIQGVADPNKGQIHGILFADFRYTLNSVDSTGAVQTREVTATVTGPLNARVTSSGSALASSSGLLEGSATAFIENGRVDNELDPTIDGTLSLDVMGFKQSDTAPTAGSLTPPSP